MRNANTEPVAQHCMFCPYPFSASKRVITVLSLHGLIVTKEILKSYDFKTNPAWSNIAKHVLSITFSSKSGMLSCLHFCKTVPNQTFFNLLVTLAHIQKTATLSKTPGEKVQLFQGENERMCSCFC